MGLHDQFDWSRPFVPQVGLEYVRGCEVEGMLDEHGRVIEEGPEPKPELTGTSRTFRVWLDTNQYQQDMARVVQGGEVSPAVVAVAVVCCLLLLLLLCCCCCCFWWCCCCCYCCCVASLRKCGFGETLWGEGAMLVCEKEGKGWF